MPDISPTNTSHREKPSKQFLALNCLHILNDGFQASLILLLPFIAAAHHFSLTKVGFLGTLTNVAGILFALPAGYIAARFGGLRTLLIALFVYVLGFVGVGLSSAYYALAGMFLLAGIGFGVFHPIAFALIAKWTPKERRGRTIGNFTAIGDVGRIAITAALSFIVVGIGLHKTVLLYAGLATVLGIGLIKFLASHEAVKVQEKPTTHMTLWQIIKNRQLVLALTSAGLDSFASASLYLFLPFLLLKRGIDPVVLGSFTAAFFVGNLFGKTLLGRLVDKFGNAQIFIVAELLMAGCIFLLANVNAAWLIIMCSIALGVFTKGTVPVMQTMMSEAVEHHGNYEKAFGLSGVVTGSTIALAPILLGAASDHWGIVAAFNIMAIVALTAVGPALAYHLVRKHS